MMALVASQGSDKQPRPYSAEFTNPDEFTLDNDADTEGFRSRFTDKVYRAFVVGFDCIGSLPSFGV